MLSLERLQNRLARSVLHGEVLGLAGMLSAGRADPWSRLRIYENNTRSSLTATLMAVFPVTARLVDERFFRYAASAFIRRQPPQEPRLVRYGEAFPAFLRGFEGLADLPFVAETARLEWAIAEALDAAAQPACPVTALNAAAAWRSPDFVLQPSLRLIVSAWPTLTIWRDHQGGDAEVPAGGWPRETQRIALWRTGERIRFQLLDAAEFAFRHALAHGQGLERAIVRARTESPMFDLAGTLARLFGDGLVTGLRESSSSTEIDGEFHEHDF